MEACLRTPYSFHTLLQTDADVRVRRVVSPRTVMPDTRALRYGLHKWIALRLLILTMLMTTQLNFYVSIDLPPPKRRRTLAGSIVSTALSAALIGTAVGLTVYRL